MDRFAFVAPMGGRRASSLFEELMGDDFKGIMNPEKSANTMNILMGNLKTDIKESETAFIVEVEMPGFDKKDINVEIEDGVLTVSAEVAKETEEKDENVKYIRRERYNGKFTRSFTFEGVDPEAVKAKYDRGILIVEVPKKQKNVAKKGIDIE